MVLNETLKAELTAVNQYLLYSKICQNWGYPRLAAYYTKESREESQHAEQLIDRILFLKGAPAMTELSSIPDCANVKEQFESDLALENEAVARLNDAIKVAGESGDNATRQLFVQILLDENHHVDFLEAQLHAINEIGLASYLTQQISIAA
jgi:bacterioferritin